MTARRAVVGAMLARDRQGGASWAIAQYVLGLERLGFEVLVVEPVTNDELADVNILRYAELAARELGIVGRHVMMSGHAVVGMRACDLRAFVDGAEVLLNISGMLPVDGVFGSIPVRVFVDLDPAFVQLWHELGEEMPFAGHTHHATVGQRVGRPGCDVPTHGLSWITFLPPVVLERWPVTRDLRWHALTTVGNWRSYGSVEHDGVHYGQKAHSWRSLMGLARRSSTAILPAVSIDLGEVADRDRLDEAGWTFVDPHRVAATPACYATFVAESWAELGIAKHGYVQSRCGWFSDRSAAYLASGRPVIAQDTGFAASLPVGEGLLAFHDTDTASCAIEDIAGRYEHHRRAARAVAEQHLDSDRVLATLLAEVGAR